MYGMTIYQHVAKAYGRQYPGITAGREEAQPAETVQESAAA